MQYIKLKDAFTIQKGKKVEQISEYQENCIRCIQIEDLRHDNLLKYCLSNEKHVLVEKEDILIAWDGANAGTVGTGLVGAVGSTLAKLTLKTDKLLSSFVAILLQSKFDYFQQTATGATIPHISRKALENIDLPVIEIEIQKNIVKVINHSLELIEKRQSQIAALDELIRSYFEQSRESDLEHHLLRNLMVETKNGMSRRGSDLDGQIVLKLKDIRPNNIKYDKANRIKLTEKELLNYSLEEKDLLLIRVNGNPNYVGRCAVFKEIDEPVYFNDHIIRIRVKGVEAKYLAYYLNSTIGQNEIQKNIKTSAGQYTISKAGLDKIKVELPSGNVQKGFLLKLDSILTMKKKFISSLREYELLYNSLLQKAFKGELFQELV